MGGAAMYKRCVTCGEEKRYTEFAPVGLRQRSRSCRCCWQEAERATHTHALEAGRQLREVEG